MKHFTTIFFRRRRSPEREKRDRQCENTTVVETLAYNLVLQCINGVILNKSVNFSKFRIFISKTAANVSHVIRARIWGS